MTGFWVGVVGALRIVQANCNKLTSGYLRSTVLFLKYGAFFECMAAVFSVLYACLTGFYGFGAATMVCAFLSAVCYVTELATSLETLKTTPLVLCNMCAMGGGVVLASIVSIVLFDEPMTLLQWVGVAAFFAAVWCLSPVQGTGTRRMTAKSWLLLTVNFLINGAASVLSKYFAVRVENGNAALYSCFTYAISSMLFLGLLALYTIRKAQKKEKEPAGPATLPRPLYLYGILLGATCASIVYLVTTLSRSVTVVVLNTVPRVISIVGCLLLGAIFFREKITVRNVCGVLCGALSVLLIVSPGV